MYKVLCDGYILHDPTSDEARVFDAILDLEVNTPNFFNFTIYPSNPSFGFIQRLKSVIEVYDDGELIFRGRPLNDTYDLHKAQTIQCEGDRAFFNDSILRPYNFSGSIENYLYMMIESHNAQVGDDKKFTLGDVTVTDPNDYIVRANSQHVKTWDEIKSKLIDNLGGYIRVRRVNDINFIDYLHDSFTISGQSIELTKNILDYQQEIDVSEIATVLIPLGAKLEDEEGSETETRLTIGSVNGGLDYIEHSTGISKYGKIWAVQVFDDVTTPQILKDKGTSSLNSLVNLGVSIEIRAIDLNFVDNSESKLRFFDYVRIISKPHEVDEEMLIKKQTININDPSQNVIEVGVQFDSFTDKQLRNDNVIRLIEANYVTNQQVTNAINMIELTPGPPTYTWIRYADDVNGSGISNDPTGKAYIGFAYNKLTATESNTASDYTWSLIQGPKGDTGVKGDTGDDGQTLYTWIKYSDNADGTGLYDVPKASTLYIGIATNKTTATESTEKTDYVWSKFKGDTGPQGPQGVEGPKGEDGKATYTWIRYADTASGEGISNNPTGKEYIGLAHNKDTATESDTPSDYTWSLIRGEQGNQGVEGPKGDDGVTTYTWIKYSANANGSELTDTPQANTAYIGIATNKTTPNESDTPSDYTWSLFKGPKGDTGYTPIKGVDYFDGIDGQDGKGIVSSIVRYQNHTNGTTAPTGTWTEDPSPIKGQYLWTRTVTTYTEGDPVTTYSVAYQAIDGTDGNDGTDGRGIVSTVVDYVKSTTATMPSTGWSTTRPTVNKGEYLWTRTTINYTSGSPSVSISNSYVPTDGQNGSSAYLWVRYSQNANGNPMTTSPVDAKYIGVATTSTGTAPTGYASYQWSLIKGTDGIPGEDGNDGQTSYLHIKYSNDGGSTFTANNGETVGDWIGTYVDFIEEDSNNVNDYTWNKVKGETGPQGVQGPKGDNGVSQYVHIRYSANSDGDPMTESPQATTKYIGLANTTSSTAPTGYASYTWSLIKGSDGVDGIPGEPGEDGNPNYTWVKYADDDLGENMSDYPSGKMYIGLAFNKTTPTESSDPLDYQWSAMYDLEAIGELRDVTTTLQSSITQNEENIAIEVSERQETDRILSEKVAEIDVDISSIRLEVSQIGGYNIISNPIGRFGTLDWTFESDHIKAYENAPYNKAYVTAPYLKAQNDNGSIMTGIPTDTQAKYGFRVWKAGKALSKITPAESGSDYSLHTKVKGDAVLRFKLREYTSATPTNKSSFFKETLLNTTNPTVEYSTYEKTITLDTTTQAVVLVVESDVSSRNQQFALFTNTSFNIGQPRPYGESITDVNNRVDDINARVTIAEDTVDLFTSRVSTVEGRVDSNTSQLLIQAGEISSKVNTNGVISAINQTAELIKINANRINLTGYVTVSSLSGQGTTTIDGSNIKTGTISANRINFNGATGTNVNLSGTITATSGKIGGWNITPTYIDSTNGQARFFLASHADSTTNYIYASNSAGTQMFSVSKAGVLYAQGVTIAGSSSGAFSGTGSGSFSGGGSFSSGYHNNGSFSSGSFDGTGNLSSGYLAGTNFYNALGGTYLNGSLTAQLRTGTTFRITDTSTGVAQTFISQSGAWRNANSDIRLKDNVKDVHNEFDNLIYSIPIIAYNYKGDTTKRIGINANFVDAMLPKEFTETFIYKMPSGYYGVDYNQLVSPLIKVAQHHNTRLIELEYEIEQLKKEMIK